VELGDLKHPAGPSPGARVDRAFDDGPHVCGHTYAKTLQSRGGDIVEDQAVFQHISELANEEHEIWNRESRGEATDADRERLRRIQVTLDQCWDLLHQRKARRAAGLDPDEAKVRDEKTVEGYVG
jgi:hypothetical protein